MIQLKGIEFRSVDNRLMALKLVQVGLSGAAMFGPDREVLQPSEVLRKKAILVERGSFRPPTVVNIDMLDSALEKFEADPAWPSARSSAHRADDGQPDCGRHDVDRRDFLARADLLAACGMTVLISDYIDYHRLAAYLAVAHRRADRHRHGRAEPDRPVRRGQPRAPARRDPGEFRPAVQERPEALRLPDADATAS